MKCFNSVTCSSKAFALTSVISSIVACGGTGQDAGQALDVDQTFSGVVIDGYIARTTVFIDSNNNGTRDAWEDFAFTDDSGYYSYNPLTQTDYCADDASASEAQYCLRASTLSTSAVIRTDGGYDVSTGEPFVGQLARRVDTSSGENMDNNILSPITTLVVDLSDDDLQTALNILDIETEDLDVDYLNTGNSNGSGNLDDNAQVDTSLFNLSLTIHKSVTLLSDYLTDTYDGIGEEYATPNDATSSVYPSLAEQLIDSGMSLDELLQDENSLASVLDNAEEALRGVYIERGLDLPVDINESGDLSDFSRIFDNVAGVNEVIDSLISPDDDEFDIDDVYGTARIIETVTIKSLEEDGVEDTSLDNAIEFILEPENSELVETLTVSLAGDNADVTALVNNNFDDFESDQDIFEAALLPEDVEPFTVIGGQSLKVSDLDLGYAPNDLKDSEVIFYFEGGPSSVQGEYTACVKYIDGANQNGDLGDGSTRGELVSGYWSLLGASENDISSYNLLTTIQFLGTTYQSIIKPYGLETIDGIEYNVIRTDTDGEIKSLYSDNGLTAYSSSIPSTSEQCEAALPSRIGI